MWPLFPVPHAKESALESQGRWRCSPPTSSPLTALPPDIYSPLEQIRELALEIIGSACGESARFAC